MRARDADRNEVVEVLEAAFVDGQLSADEREQRVAEALNAVDLEDLRVLVKDLQNAPERFKVGVVASVRAAASGVPPRRALGFGAAALVLAVGVPLTVSALDSDESPISYSSPATQEQKDLDAAVEHSASFVVMWSDVKTELTSGQPANQREGQVPTLEPWEVSEQKVDDLFEVIHNQFDAPYLTKLSLWPDSFSFSRPLKGTQPRTEDWSYSKTSGVRASVPEVEGGRDLALFDVRDIDVEALFRNLDTALATLDVADAKLHWIDVTMDPSDGVPVISIWVTNRFKENAWLETTLDGRVFKTWPFTGS